MKDIDFDELDRAVNSLMANASKSKSVSDTGQQDAPAEKTLTITPTLGSPLPSSPVNQPEATVKPARPLPARRGRFMDVVRSPVSTAKGQPFNSSRPPSRQGVTIQQPAPSMPPKEEAEKPLAYSHAAGQNMKEPTPSVSAQPDSSSAPQGEGRATNDWPDPLDMAGFKEKETTPEQSSPAVSAPEASQKATLAERAETNEDDSLSSSLPLSPFLMGTKVEKRPLGGEPSAPEPDQAPVFADSAVQKTVDNPDAQLPASPAKVEAELPEELQGDLVAVEADTARRPEATPSAPAPLPAEKSTPPTPRKEVPLLAKGLEEKLLPAGPSSIPQQYHEEPSSGDAKSGAIYDTDTYHKPLAHPAKKKSGWLWVLWIILILLAGAGAGAAVYMLGIV